MKCVKQESNGKIFRVEDKKASDLVKAGYSYCTKTEWKNQKGVKKT